MLQEILTTESFWFWTLVIVQSGLIMWFAEAGNPIAAAVTIGTLVLGVAFFPTQWETIGLADLHETSFSSWLLDILWPLIAFIGCYILIGITWATFRWWLLGREIRDRYERIKADWLAPGNLRNTASRLRSRAENCSEPTLKARYAEWSEACLSAATAGGNRLTQDLKPVWKEYVTNGSRL